MIDRKDIPIKVRPFVDLGFDYGETRTAGNQCYGECTFCGGKNKLYINTSSNQTVAQWDCKSCGERGNTYTYMKLWHEAFMEDQENPDYNKVWNNLADSRKLPVEVLKKAEIVYDGDLFFIPIRNLQGSITNLRYYKLQTSVPKSGKKSRIFGLTGIDAGIFGLHTLAERGTEKDTIFICEGEWDTIALKHLLDEEEEPGRVLGIPGANTFKKGWEEFFNDRKVILCYDVGTAGAQGLERAYNHLKKVSASIQYVDWPSSYTDGYDIRDFVTNEGSFSDLMEMVKDYMSPVEREAKKEEQAKRIPISSKARPTFSQVLKVYSNNIEMTPDLRDALKISFAVILSTQLPGDPLWMHVIGPPGSGKTLIVSATGQCASTYHLSKLKPKDLMSGFIAKNGEDPSLIPRLDGRCLVIKDFTTTIAMPSMIKEELYGVLRDAYDGDAAQDYANNVKRRYKSHFSVLTGVTPAIYGERSDVLGARFLYLHILKGIDYDNQNVLSSAFDAVVEAKGEKIAEELLAITALFLDVNISLEELPFIPEEYKWKIIAIAEICAALRASVERNVFHRKSEGRALKWRPQPEVATRLVKQLAKLVMASGLVNYPAKIGEEEYRLACRVALDSCIGFNMEVVRHLVDTPGQDRQQISEACSIPLTTLDDQLEDLMELGVVYRERRQADGSGNRPYEYCASKRLVNLWAKAGLSSQKARIKNVAEDKAKGWVAGGRRFKTKSVRRHKK